MELVKENTLEYYRCREIAVPHGFTTRLGGVSQGPVGSLNLSLHRQDPEENVRENHHILARALGYELENLVLSHQAHTDIIRVVTKQDALGLDHHLQSVCDGLITRDSGTALCIFTADCTPILLWDPITGAVGAVHAGWRGTASNIAGKAVLAMAQAFGCEPRNLRAAIGPNIGACCFEAGPEVPQAMTEAFGPQANAFILPKGEKFFLDLKKLNALALEEAGVTHITLSGDCTLCQSQRYFSHRGQGQSRGSQGAMIVCKEVGL